MRKDIGFLWISSVVFYIRYLKPFHVWAKRPLLRIERGVTSINFMCLLTRLVAISGHFFGRKAIYIIHSDHQLRVHSKEEKEK